MLSRLAATLLALLFVARLVAGLADWLPADWYRVVAAILR